MADTSSRDGATYATPDVLRWLADNHGAHDAALDQAFRADELHGIPAIQIGPAEGQTLALLLRLARAKRVVEIGTLAGYSAIWMARALPADGRLITLENDAKHAEIARSNLDAAGVGHKVEVRVGDALDSLASLSGTFCAVFVDADKGRYDRYGEWARGHLREGGLLIGDNAFFFGDLLDPEKSAAAAMRRFHQDLAKYFDSTCIPTPDGLAVGVFRGDST